MDLARLNALDREAFVGALGGVFEHSPWVAEQAWPQRPFADVATLHAAMCAAVRQAGPAAQLALIRAHPQLAGKAAIAGALSADSAREQRGAGLDQCSPAEYLRLAELNAVYEARFGFPYILAVRGLDRQGILANLAARVANARQVEMAEALRQIERIAAFRLADMMDTPVPPA
jgi:2-oxo-4-hydroxy-4-carboxy-5-ureidoimidazoline decarboxylase